MVPPSRDYSETKGPTSVEGADLHLPEQDREIQECFEKAFSDQNIRTAELKKFNEHVRNRAVKMNREEFGIFETHGALPQDKLAKYRERYQEIRKQVLEKFLKENT